MITRAAYAFATTHHGLLRRTDATRLGISVRGWYREIDAGHLVQLHPGVVTVAGAPATTTQRILAAVWACRPVAVASHRSAAWLWGVERPAEDPVDVVCRRGMHSEPPGIVAHHPRDRIEVGPILRGAVPATSPLRMLVDLGAVDPTGVSAAMEHVLVSRLAAPQAVIAVLERHAGKGRHGVTALREAIARYPFALDVADSVLERLMLDVVRKHGLPPVKFHAVVEGFEVDFLVLGTCVILECDGRRWHEYRFEDDRIRDQKLMAAGWLVLRFTWRQLTRNPAGVAHRIEQVLAAFPRSGSGS